MALGGYTAAKVNSSGGAALATFVVITGATTVVGHMLGREADRKVTSIRIVP